MQCEKSAVLITGGAKRIGAFIAKIFARYNYDVLIHYNQSKDQALKTKKSIKKNFNVDVECMQQDLTLDVNYKDFIDLAVKKFPHLNCIVNNASVFLGDNLMNVTSQNFNKHYRIHVEAPFFLIQNFLKIHNINLKIINIIDKFIYKKTTSNYFSYLLSKKTLHIMTEMIKEHVLQKQIDAKIYSIYPGKILEQGVEQVESLQFIKDAMIKILNQK